VWSVPERLECEVLQKVRYINTLTFTFTFTIAKRGITPILKSPHWLKVNKRMEYKLLSLTYKVLTTTQPIYLNNLISVQPPRSLLSPFSPANYLLIENHRSLIQICITPFLESTPWFIPSTSPVMSPLTSSFTCQLISVIITTLIIHHSFTLSLPTQNLPFQSFPP